MVVNFQEMQKIAKLRLLKMHFEAGVGHIGGNFSALDAMLFLHHEVMQSEDNFILAKGHAAGALYVTLWSQNKISDDQLKTFHGDGTKLAGHPIINFLPEIPFATGSLGHGLGLACGMALGYKLQNKSGRFFCLMSDGEWQEGSNFEALVFLRHHELQNVTVLIDCNGLQGFGSTNDVASLDVVKLYNLFQSLDLSCEIIDGHDVSDLRKISLNKNKTQIFLLRTIKGKGVSFMENQMQWHYLPLTSELYNQAKCEIEQAV